MRIKIAYVVNYIVKNGPGNVVLNLINNLDRKKYEIALITLFEGNDSGVISQLRNNDVTVYECKSLSRMKCLIGQEKEFLDIVNGECFDILHTHGFIPDILSSRLYTNAKRISTIHNNMYEDYPDTYGLPRSLIFITWHHAALRKLEECVCCSESVYDVMKHKLKNVSFIRNGIEKRRANSFVSRADLRLPANAFVYIYVGVLNSRKNIAWLIGKFVKYHEKNEYLLVLGTGEKEAECKAKADNHVKMLGFQTDPIAYMNISDVYVSASKSEGFSVSILEALACGLGLFLSDIPSHREVVEMGEDVYLGEIFSVDDIYNKLRAFRDKKICKAEIAAFQEKNLSAKEMTERYQRVYEGDGRT